MKNTMIFVVALIINSCTISKEEELNSINNNIKSIFLNEGIEKCIVYVENLQLKNLDELDSNRIKILQTLKQFKNFSNPKFYWTIKNGNNENKLYHYIKNKNSSIFKFDFIDSVFRGNTISNLSDILKSLKIEDSLNLIDKKTKQIKLQNTINFIDIDFYTSVKNIDSEFNENNLSIITKKVKNKNITLFDLYLEITNFNKNAYNEAVFIARQNGLQDRRYVDFVSEIKENYKYTFMKKYDLDQNLYMIFTNNYCSCLGKNSNKYCNELKGNLPNYEYWK